MLAAVILLAVVAGGGWLLGFSSVLATDRVVVLGTRRVPTSEVVAAAAVPLGLSLVRQDLTAIAQRATTVPAVESAVVRREWPDTIVVSVVERAPVIGVREIDGWLLIDRQGVGFETRPTLPPGVIQADVRSGDLPRLRDVGSVAGALPETLAKKVDRIEAPSRDSITLRLTSGLVVTWGSVADSPLKAEVVGALLKRKPSQSIDVSSPHSPAIR